MLVTNTEREKKKNNGRGEQQVGKNKNLEVFGFDRFEYSFFFNKRRAMKRLSDGYIRMIFLLLFVCFFFFNISRNNYHFYRFSILSIARRRKKKKKYNFSSRERAYLLFYLQVDLIK